MVGKNTFVPINWLCKKQGAMSHSSAEAEIISMDACLRLEGLPSLILWDLIIDIFNPQTKSMKKDRSSPSSTSQTSSDTIKEMFGSIDYVPPSLPITNGKGKLYVFEDNDAVIKMTVKGRSPALAACLSYSSCGPGLALRKNPQ